MNLTCVEMFITFSHDKHILWNSNQLLYICKDYTHIIIIINCIKHTCIVGLNGSEEKNPMKSEHVINESF